MKPRQPKVVCSDGFSISIQANQYAYCSPRSDYGPYRMVECGFPSATPGPELMEYADTPEDPTGTIYGYVPVEVVKRELKSHGDVLLTPPFIIDTFFENL